MITWLNHWQSRGSNRVESSPSQPARPGPPRRGFPGKLLRASQPRFPCLPNDAVGSQVPFQCLVGPGPVMWWARGAEGCSLDWEPWARWWAELGHAVSRTLFLAPARVFLALPTPSWAAIPASRDAAPPGGRQSSVTRHWRITGANYFIRSSHR